MQENSGRQRGTERLGGLAVAVARVLAAGLTLFCLLWTVGVLSQVGIYFLAMRVSAIFLTVISVLVFLLVPAKAGESGRPLPWYDILLILLSLCSHLYVLINASNLTNVGRITASPVEIALGLAGVITLIEAMRRLTGWALPILAIVLLLYAKFGYLLPGAFGIPQFSWSRLMALIYLSPTGIYSGIVNLASGIIIAFIAFGVFFVAAGGGDFFYNLAASSVSWMRGGPAKAAIVGSAIFGTVSGSAVANVSVTGAVTIPLMKRIGYEPAFAGAIESVASTGGILMPPIMGAIAFVMAQFLGVPYRAIVLAAIIPAILYFVALFFQTDLRAARKGLKGIPRSELPPIFPTIKAGWQFVIPFAVLIGLLFVLRYPAGMAAVYSIGALIVIGMFKKKTRFTPGRIVNALSNSTEAMFSVGILCGVAGILLGVLSGSGLGPKISSLMVDLAGGQLVTLVILAAVICYIMGMGVSILVSYILLAALVAPTLEKFGIPPMVAHFFILYMGSATFFTPPFCPAAFVASSISGAKPFSIGFQAMRLGIVVFIVPFIFIYNPALLLIGSATEIVLGALTAIVGVFAMSVALEGYLLIECNWLQRVLAGLAGITMIVPGGLSDIFGIGLLAVVVLWQLWAKKRAVALKAGKQMANAADTDALVD